MRNIIKLAAGLFIVVVSISSVKAQDSLQKLKNATPEQRAAFQTKLMKEKLSLDPAQLSKVSSINLKYAQKFQPLLKSDESRFSKIRLAKALMAQKDKELRAVFTKRQFEVYSAVEQEIREKLKSQMKEQN